MRKEMKILGFLALIVCSSNLSYGGGQGNDISGGNASQNSSQGGDMQAGDMQGGNNMSAPDTSMPGLSADTNNAMGGGQAQPSDTKSNKALDDFVKTANNVQKDGFVTYEECMKTCQKAVAAGMPGITADQCEPGCRSDEEKNKAAQSQDNRQDAGQNMAQDMMQDSRQNMQGNSQDSQQDMMQGNGQNMQDSRQDSQQDLRQSDDAGMIQPDRQLSASRSQINDDATMAQPDVVPVQR